MAAEPIAATCIAFAVALLWVVHPLTTQSVTYLIQRAESLMALCYLLTLYCVMRGATSARPRGWYAAAVVACAMGMGSKAIMVTAPLVVLLFDRAFLADSFQSALRRRWVLYLGLAATWIIPIAEGTAPAVFATAPNTKETVGFAFRGISPTEYALTEPGVIRQYLKLALWPRSLCLDYDWPIAPGWTAVFPDLVVVALLVSATLWACWKHPRAGFVAAAFFVILAPTSSFIPIQDPIFEHRMYLPLAAVVVSVVTLTAWLLASILERRRRPARLAAMATAALALCAAAPLAYATHRRNLDYHSDGNMWRDVARKRPNSGRARYNLGHNLFGEGRFEEAIAQMREAVRINPRWIDWQFGLGLALLQSGRAAEAVGPLRDTLKLAPRHAEAHVVLGAALFRTGATDEAVQHYKEALGLGLNRADLHFNVGNGYMAQGRDDLAQPHFDQAIRLDPSFTEAYINLGNIATAAGRPQEALDRFRAALAAEAPRGRGDILAKAHFNIGNTLLGQEQFEEAIESYRAAMVANPQHAQARYGLGRALGQAGRWDEAAEAYEECLRLNPNQHEAQDALNAIRGAP